MNKTKVAAFITRLVMTDTRKTKLEGETTIYGFQDYSKFYETHCIVDLFAFGSFTPQKKGEKLLWESIQVLPKYGKENYSIGSLHERHDYAN